MEAELNTFGAILEYAMHLEDEARGFYEAAAERAKAPALAEAARELAAAAGKLRQTLERVRRENVTEMILTPIDGFRAGDYAPSFAVPQGDAQVRAAAVRIEEEEGRFYAMARAKIELAEAARALGRLGKEHQSRAEMLGEIGLG